MNIIASAPIGLRLCPIAQAMKPGHDKFDPFGFVTGFKVFKVDTSLESVSDAELAEMGFDRENLPRAAMQAADGGKA